MRNAECGMGKMADVSFTEFIPAIKKIEASALYDDELLENSFLNKFNASDELLILLEEQLKTPNAIDGKAGMSFITNKLVSSLDLHDLEQFIDKKYCETRQRVGINCYDNNSLSASEEVYSSLNRCTKYGIFGNSPSSAFYMDVDTQFDRYIPYSLIFKLDDSKDSKDSNCVCHNKYIRN